jgi:tetratricopeptide (TPR) repeat protein
MNLIAVVSLLAAAALLRGPTLQSAWYNNLGSHALSLEWNAVREAPGIPLCQQWIVDSAAAQPVAQALRMDAQNERARFNAGRVAWLLGDCETALDAWSNVESSDVIAHLERANGLCALGREEEALVLYREINGAADYLHMRGALAEASQRTDAAAAWYELGIRVLPTLATAQRLAELYQESEQHDAAVAVWRRLSEGTQEADPDHWWALGQSAELAEDWETAARVYDRGAERSHDPCRFWEPQESALERLEEWARAEGVAHEALDACPERLWPYLRLGGLQSRQADYAGALFWYGQAEVLWPEHVSPKFYLGVIHFEQTLYEQAEMYFQQALALDPHHLWSMYHLAWCFHESQEKPRAVDTLSRAIELDPGEPWRWARLLGDWQFELGHREEALSAYRQALLWHPGDESIRERIERLLELGL